MELEVPLTRDHASILRNENFAHILVKLLFQLCMAKVANDFYLCGTATLILSKVSGTQILVVTLNRTLTFNMKSQRILW